MSKRRGKIRIPDGNRTHDLPHTGCILKALSVCYWETSDEPGWRRTKGHGLHIPVRDSALVVCLAPLLKVLIEKLVEFPRKKTGL